MGREPVCAVSLSLPPSTVACFGGDYSLACVGVRADQNQRTTNLKTGR
jgi:hypothetical protein